MKSFMRLILVAITANFIYSSNLYAEDNCDQYARQAVIQHIENLKYNCGFSSKRWTPYYQKQRQWCKQTTPQKRKHESSERTRLLKACTSRIPEPKWSQLPSRLKQKIIRQAISVAKANDVTALSIFHACHIDLRYAGSHERLGSPLYWAISSHAKQAIPYLLQMDNPNRTIRNGMPALSHFLKRSRKDYSLLELLLAHKANPNSFGKRTTLQSTPLHTAIQQQDIKATRLLLKYNASPNLNDGFTYILEAALQTKNPKLIKLLVQKGAHPNLSNNICNAVKSGLRKKLPLDEANKLGNAALVSLMRQKGAITAKECL